MLSYKRWEKDLTLTKKLNSLQTQNPFLSRMPWTQYLGQTSAASGEPSTEEKQIMNNSEFFLLCTVLIKASEANEKHYILKLH